MENPNLVIENLERRKHVPELPEVEQVRRGLNSLIPGKVISKIDIKWPRIINNEMSVFTEKLKGNRILTIDRRGKYLIFHLEEGILVAHLRMEGKFIYLQDPKIETLPNKHVHVIFSFQDGTGLAYQDVRKFGRMEWIENQDLTKYFLNKNLGPEPSKDQFDCDEFIQALSRSNMKIKPLLLSQKIVAGIGNIYADEILFQAKIRPDRSAKNISYQEARILHQVIISIMKEAIAAGGSTVRSYLDGLGQKGSYQQYHKVYNRTGQPCVYCGQPIQKYQLAQRGTHYCLHCQR